MLNAIFNRKITPIYESPNVIKNSDYGIVSTIADEGIYGNEVKVIKCYGDWVEIETDYGYKGYVLESNLNILTSKKWIERQKTNLMVIDRNCVDVLSLPIVQGLVYTTLYRGSIVEVLSGNCDKNGWTKIRLLDGNEGFIRSVCLIKRKVQKVFDFNELLDKYYHKSEGIFRKSLVETAMNYINTQYRWGGKTNKGIDCSGLTFMSYYLNGVIIWRDSTINKQYPICEVPFNSIRIGDLLYFPGHIAMYIGNRQYIHATGNDKNGCVVINSLDEEASNYREDLCKSMYAVGGLRKSRRGL